MRLTWEAQPLRLKAPFRIARSTTRSKDAVLVRLDHDGLVGYGEAVASRYYRQDLAAILDTLNDLADVITGLTDPFALRDAPDILAARCPGQTSTLAALDAAAYDWIGKRTGRPVHDLLGLASPNGRPTALTLGIDAPEATARLARAAAASGAPILKLKVGLATLDEDRALVAEVRAGAPDATLYLDANGGWSPEDASERIAALAEFRPALVEQPIAPGQLDALARISAASPVPVVADEDANTFDDIPRLAGRVAGVNVKLIKCGGLHPALTMIRAARAAGLQVMLGCMVSSSLGIAPAAHLADLADYLDLDGHLFLAHDPWRGLDALGGRLSLAERPGLGVERSTEPVAIGHATTGRPARTGLAVREDDAD